MRKEQDGIGWDENRVRSMRRDRTKVDSANRRLGGWGGGGGEGGGVGEVPRLVKNRPCKLYLMNLLNFETEVSDLIF